MQQFITYCEHPKTGTKQGGKGKTAGEGEQRQFAAHPRGRGTDCLALCDRGGAFQRTPLGETGWPTLKQDQREGSSLGAHFSLDFQSCFRSLDGHVLLEDTWHLAHREELAFSGCPWKRWGVFLPMRSVRGDLEATYEIRGGWLRRTGCGACM
jgi:hypothetical protein